MDSQVHRSEPKKSGYYTWKPIVFGSFHSYTDLYFVVIWVKCTGIFVTYRLACSEKTVNMIKKDSD